MARLVARGLYDSETAPIYFIAPSKSLWGYAFAGDTSTVTVHMRRLREKIEPDPAHPRYLQTVWGVGYRFVG
jgi:hypothetical protein